MINRDVVERMTREELHATIAKIKGICIHHLIELSALNLFGEPVWKCDKCGEEFCGEQFWEGWNECPNWTGYINDAWKLLEELVDTPGSVSIQTEYHSQDEGGHFTVVFREYPTSMMRPIICEGDHSAPIAICRAYILARQE